MIIHDTVIFNSLSSIALKAQSPKQSSQAAASFRLPNQRAVGIKISGKTMEATNTYGIVSVPGKFNVLTRIAAATLRCAVPNPITLRTAGSRPLNRNRSRATDNEKNQRQEPSEPIKLMMLETFNPTPVTSMSSSAKPEALFNIGAQCWASSGEFDLNRRPSTSGRSMVMIRLLAISHGLTSTPGSSTGRARAHR